MSAVLEPIINAREQARESLRRARIDQDYAQRALQGARSIHSMISRGVKVVHEDVPDLEAAESRAREAAEHVAELEAVVQQIDREQAEKEAKKARAAAEAREKAIKEADRVVLDARRAVDLAYLKRLDLAKAAGKSYAAAVDEHIAAQRALLAAVTDRELLEDDDE